MTEEERHEEEVEEIDEAIQLVSLLVESVHDLTLAVGALARAKLPKNVTAAEAAAFARVCAVARAARHDEGAVDPKHTIDAVRLQRISHPVDLDTCRSALAVFRGDIVEANRWLLFDDSKERENEIDERRSKEARGGE